MNYEKKYLKYKSKYIQLKKMIGGADPEQNYFDEKLPEELKANVYKFLSCDDIILKSSDEKEREIIVRYIKLLGEEKFSKKIWIDETKDAVDNEEKFRIFKKLCLKNSMGNVYINDILELSIKNPEVIDNAIKLRIADIIDYNIEDIIKISIENPEKKIIDKAIYLKKAGIKDYYIKNILELSIKHPEVIDDVIELRKNGIENIVAIQYILELSIEHPEVIDNAIKLRKNGIEDIYAIRDILKLSIEHTEVIDNMIKLRKASIKDYYNAVILKLSIEHPEKKIIDNAIELKEGGIENNHAIKDILELSIGNPEVIDNTIKLRKAGIENIYDIRHILKLSIENPKVIEKAIELRKNGN